MEAPREMAKSQLPGNIYRCKGVACEAEAPQQRAVLQVAGRRADVALFDEWGERTPQTQIAAIGASGSIDGEDIREKFETCISENERSAVSGR